MAIITSQGYGDLSSSQSVNSIAPQGEITLPTVYDNAGLNRQHYYLTHGGFQGGLGSIDLTSLLTGSGLLLLVGAGVLVWYLTRDNKKVIAAKKRKLTTKYHQDLAALSK